MTPTSHSYDFSFRDVTSPGHTCSECKRPLTGRALTCSPKCRKARERRQKDAHSAHIMAMHELHKIRDSLKRHEDIDHFREQLHRLRDEITDLLLLAKDADVLARQEMLEARARRWK